MLGARRELVDIKRPTFCAVPIPMARDTVHAVGQLV
jgi:hypothetical protein